MITTPSANLAPMATVTGRKLLIGRVDAAISADAYVVLVKADGTDNVYRLIQVATDTSDKHDPATLGAFLAPEDVDHSEITTALAMADELSRPKPKRKTRKRSKAGATK